PSSLSPLLSYPPPPPPPHLHSFPTRRSSDLSASHSASSRSSCSAASSYRPLGQARRALSSISGTPASARETGQPALASSARRATDRKSTRLNSSHQIISYAVFCLKKKTTIQN